MAGQVESARWRRPLVTRRAFAVGLASAGVLGCLGAAARALGAEASLLRPPGNNSEDQMLGACIRCGRCVEACGCGCAQYGSLRQGLLNDRTPYLDFTKGYCDFCGSCIDSCPTGALGQLDVSSGAIGFASVDRQRCVSCERCVDACSFAAISWDAGLAAPSVDRALCNGCGACEWVCPSSSFGFFDGAAVRAIHVVREEAFDEQLHGR